MAKGSSWAQPGDFRRRRHLAANERASREGKHINRPKTGYSLRDGVLGASQHRASLWPAARRGNLMEMTLVTTAGVDNPVHRPTAEHKT